MKEPENTTKTQQSAHVTDPQEHARSGDDTYMDFLAFRKFATPALVQIVFWAGTIASLVWGFGIIDAADEGWRGTNTAMVWAGIGVIVLGPATLRIAGELILVVFRIHEQIGQLAKADD